MSGNERQQPEVRIGWRVGRLVALIAAMLAITGMGIYQVHQRYAIVRLGYQLDQARFEHRTLLERQKRLQLSLATWEDPATVKSLATQRLNMKVPGPGDELEVPGAHTGAEAPVKGLLEDDRANAPGRPAGGSP